MKPGIRYIVKKGSDDGTFQVGDQIWLASDGSLSCRQALGWIEKDDVPEAMSGVEYELDRAWAQRQIAKALAEAERIKLEYA
jgi:hypothetical protein